MSPDARRHAVAAALIALVPVVVIGLATEPTPPTSDSLSYINLAESGLRDNPTLAAPYAYRFGAPLIVRAIHLACGLSTGGAFHLVASLSAWGLLLASYALARSTGGTLFTGYAAMGVTAFSFFTLKFSIAVPTMVDAEGLLLVTVSFLALLRKEFVLSLFLSCSGIFFKEFLLVPCALLVFMNLREYRETRATPPLLRGTLTLVIAGACFIIPRIAIPVLAGYGANSRWDFPSPSHWAYFEHLRYFLSGRPDAGRIVNICFALSSFWLPVLLLVTPERARRLWHTLAPVRTLCLLDTALVLLLALFGGTNIMIFVAYTLPVMVVVLAALLDTGVRRREVVFMLAIVLLFNRIPFSTGGPSSTIDDVFRFYGGWWSRLDGVTLVRTAEMCAYLILFGVLRMAFGRKDARDVRPT